MSSPRRSVSFGKMVFAIVGLGLAALSVGATDAEYPVLGRDDQGLEPGACPPSLVDGIRVCVPAFEASVGVSVVTVAPGLSIVQ
jgi:hypothetical protein